MRSKFTTLQIVKAPTRCYPLWYLMKRTTPLLQDVNPYLDRQLSDDAMQRMLGYTTSRHVPFRGGRLFRAVSGVRAHLEAGFERLDHQFLNRLRSR